MSCYMSDHKITSEHFKLILEVFLTHSNKPKTFTSLITNAIKEIFSSRKN